ncbi:hypothetical protein [Dyadobacter aurulentus]|uniref:hypothetical protein n=1 Tax=Dyadobacter sp. UC 10 TaxID=2605428 RepID=UPI0011F2F6F1|nr:hypothetical protein [Dyadobacter sp. UC 10]KAA0990477.1 hypothetical protein FXO21_10075 [Dyadobacter sp. UC 10]
METALTKSELVARLRNDILSLQGFLTSAPGVKNDDVGLGPVMKAFPRACSRVSVCTSGENGY